MGNIYIPYPDFIIPIIYNLLLLTGASQRGYRPRVKRRYLGYLDGSALDPRPRTLCIMSR